MEIYSSCEIVYSQQQQHQIRNLFLMFREIIFRTFFPHSLQRYTLSTNARKNKKKKKSVLLINSKYLTSIETKKEKN